MSPLRAQKIVGFDITITGDDAIWWTLVGTHPTYGYEIRIKGRDKKTAVTHFVERNYHTISGYVMSEQDYKCFTCHLIRPLQIDHIVPRAQGRLDTRANLRALCPDCHGIRHGIKVIQ